MNTRKVMFSMLINFNFYLFRSSKKTFPTVITNTFGRPFQREKKDNLRFNKMKHFFDQKNVQYRYPSIFTGVTSYASIKLEPSHTKNTILCLHLSYFPCNPRFSPVFWSANGQNRKYQVIK